MDGVRVVEAIYLNIQTIAAEHILEISNKRLGQTLNRKPRDPSPLPEAPALVSHDLDAAIPYLVTRAGARMGGAFSKALKAYGLSLSEWRVCASLNHLPQQSLSELVVHSSVDMSALSRIVDGLVQAGLVKRERCAADGRAIRLSLSGEGMAATQQLIPLAKHYEAVALSDFSAAEAETLRKLLRRLYTNAAALEPR